MWYLVSLATLAYIGPVSEPACKMAAATLHAEGVACYQAISLRACDVTGRPGFYTACPEFNIPTVRAK